MRQVLRRLAAIAVLCVSADGRCVAQAVSRTPLLGRLVPTFAWPALEDSTAVISPLSLQGSVVLIDLWGTWCAPCRREMPFLHAAYARFHAQGFDIVSVAFDQSPGKVQAYRRTQHPMPWQHVFATRAIEAEATRLFGVDSFPRALLIGRDGTVLRIDTGLRGPALAATLDTLLNLRSASRR